MLAALCGGAVAGAALHSGGQECPMGEMKDGTDCCARAHAQQVTPEVEAARLCCAINCPSSGATTPTAPLLRASPPVTTAHHPAVSPTAFVVPVAPLRFDSARDHPQHSPPPYIRHHALLI
jgi:hypothetical protein